MSTLTSTFQRRPAYKYIRESDRLPTYDQLGDAPVARVRLFNPTGHGTWYLCSYDPDSGNAFGLTIAREAEIGTFNMLELVAYRGRYGLPIERDLSFRPRLLAECEEYPAGEQP